MPRTGFWNPNYFHVFGKWSEFFFCKNHRIISRWSFYAYVASAPSTTTKVSICRRLFGASSNAAFCLLSPNVNSEANRFVLCYKIIYHYPNLGKRSHLGGVGHFNIFDYPRNENGDVGSRRCGGKYQLAIAPTYLFAKENISKCPR